MGHALYENTEPYALDSKKRLIIDPATRTYIPTIYYYFNKGGVRRVYEVLRNRVNNPSLGREDRDVYAERVSRLETEGVLDLLDKMLALPTKRISLREVLEHPCLQRCLERCAPHVPVDDDTASSATTSAAAAAGAASGAAGAASGAAVSRHLTASDFADLGLGAKAMQLVLSVLRSRTADTDESKEDDPVPPQSATTSVSAIGTNGPDDPHHTGTAPGPSVTPTPGTPVPAASDPTNTDTGAASTTVGIG